MSLSRRSKTLSNQTPHSEHYQRSTIEPWDVVDAWFVDFPSCPSTAYYLGNALKYMARAGHKEEQSIVKDLEKCLAYVKKALEVERGYEV